MAILHVVMLLMGVLPYASTQTENNETPPNDYASGVAAGFGIGVSITAAAFIVADIILLVYLRRRGWLSIPCLDRKANGRSKAGKYNRQDEQTEGYEIPPSVPPAAGPTHDTPVDSDGKAKGRRKARNYNRHDKQTDGYKFPPSVPPAAGPTHDTPVDSDKEANGRSKAGQDEQTDGYEILPSVPPADGPTHDTPVGSDAGRRLYDSLQMSDAGMRSPYSQLFHHNN